MNKYILYRIGKSLDEEEVYDNEILEEEELVSVEYGDSLDDVLEDILRDIRDDLSGMSEYEKCDVRAGGPLDGNYDLGPFDFVGIVAPPVAEKNILFNYTVEVESV